MMRVGVVLMVTAAISYVILPAVKPINTWQSFGIHLCLIVAYIASTIQRQAVADPLLDGVRTAVNNRPTPTVDPTQQVAQMVEVLTSATPGFVPAKAAVNTSPQEREVKPEVSKTGPPAYLVKPKAAPGTLDHFMFQEIEAINATLAAHKIDGRVFYVPTKNNQTPHMAAPSFFGYRVVRKPGQKIDAIAKINLELSAAITDVRNRMGYRGSTMVRIADFPTAIETPRPEPLPLLFRNVAVDPMQALIGRVYNFDGAQDVTINLVVDHHTLFAGMSGYGKSNVMRVGLTSLILNNDFGDVKFLLADLKGKDLAVFADLPNVIAYANTPEGADSLISQAVEIMEERQAMATYPYRLVFAIDELAEVREEMRGQLARLLKLGRDMEINVWGGTQRPTAKEIGDGVNQGFTLRFVSRVTDASSARFVAAMPGTGAEQIDTPGDFLMIRSSRVDRLRTFELSREENARIIGAIDYQEPESELGNDTSAIPPKLVEVFKAYYDEATGDLARGGKAEAKRALFGKANVAAKGRKASDQASVINEHFQRWKQTL